MALTTHTIHYLNYDEMVDIIQDKHDIDIRNYALHNTIKATGLKNPRGTILGECLAYMEFKGFDPQTWIDSQGKDWLHSSELSLMKHADTKAGIWVDYPAIPYQDFWHFILGHLEVNQGAIHTMNFAYFRDASDQDWQKEIAQLFVDEFGDQSLKVMIDW